MGQVVWESGTAYEAYVGRWSRRVARVFVPWLAVQPGRRWLDAGCGTGALTSRITLTEPALVVGVDPSPGFLKASRFPRAPTDTPEPTGFPRPSRLPRAPTGTPAPAGFLRVAGDAVALPLAAARFDAVVSALMLNFVSDPGAAVREFTRVAAPGGIVAAYVWDYADAMSMMRHFWDAAADLDPAATALAENLRFNLCRPDVLTRLWSDAALRNVTTRRIEIDTVFRDFDDYWQPFLGGQGPAPGYVASLPDASRTALRDHLRSSLPTRPDGTIALTAAAWAVQGTR